MAWYVGSMAGEIPSPVGLLDGDDIVDFRSRRMSSMLARRSSMRSILCSLFPRQTKYARQPITSKPPHTTDWKSTPAVLAPKAFVQPPWSDRQS